MATTRKPAARKTTARKVAAKPAASVKKTVNKTVKPATKKTVASPTEQMVETIAAAGEAANDRLADAVELARRVADTSVGIPFVAQERLAEVSFDRVKRFDGLDLTKFDLAPVKAFFAEAEKVGHERIADFQQQVENLTAPVAKRIDASVNMVGEKFEAQVPEQVREFVSESAERVRKLVAA